MPLNEIVRHQRKMTQNKWLETYHTHHFALGVAAQPGVGIEFHEGRCMLFDSGTIR